MKRKKWSRKGRCPSCNVGCGSSHKKTCTFDYETGKKQRIKIPLSVDELDAIRDGASFDWEFDGVPVCVYLERQCVRCGDEATKGDFCDECAKDIPL